MVGAACDDYHHDGMVVVSASGGTSLCKAFHTFQAALRMCSSPLPAEEAASSSLSALVGRRFDVGPVAVHPNGRPSWA